MNLNSVERAGSILIQFNGSERISRWVLPEYNYGGMKQPSYDTHEEIIAFMCVFILLKKLKSLLFLIKLDIAIHDLIYFYI